MDNIFTALFFILLASIVILPAALDHRRFLKEQETGGPLPESAIPPLSRKEWLKRLSLIFCAMFAFCSLLAISKASEASPTDSGVISFFSGIMISLAFLFSLPVIIFSLVALAFPRKRRIAVTLLSAFVMFFICTTFWGWVGDGIRDRGLLAFTERSKPLVCAIEAYRKDHGQPPASLKDLIPAYLSSIPQTGLGVCPEYQYWVQNAYNLPWQLSIHPTPNPFNFSQLVYDPKHQIMPYSDEGMRYGDWIYILE